MAKLCFISSIDLLYSWNWPICSGKLIEANKLEILDECHCLHTNSIYTVKKILDLEMSKLEMFFKKLSSASTKNWWDTYFKLTDIKKLTEWANVTKMFILKIHIYQMGKRRFHKIIKKSCPIKDIYCFQHSRSIFHIKWVNLMYKTI